MVPEETSPNVHFKDFLTCCARHLQTFEKISFVWQNKYSACAG